MVPPHPVGNAMRPERVQPWIAQQDFRHAPRRRVFIEHGLDIFSQALEHASRPFSRFFYYTPFFM
jgi:hypothetical protein